MRKTNTMERDLSSRMSQSRDLFETRDDSLFREGIVRRRRAELIAKMNTPKAPVETPNGIYGNQTNPLKKATSTSQYHYPSPGTTVPELCYSLINFKDPVVHGNVSSNSNANLNFLNQSNDLCTHITGSIYTMKPACYSDISETFKTIHEPNDGSDMSPLKVYHPFPMDNLESCHDDSIYNAPNDGMMTKSCQLMSRQPTHKRVVIEKSVLSDYNGNQVKNNSQPQPIYPRNICFVCSGVVKSFERITYNGMIFHRHCLRCNVCDMPLRQDEVRILKENGKIQILCDLHYKYLKDSIIPSSESQKIANLKSKIVKDHIKSPFLAKRQLINSSFSRYMDRYSNNNLSNNSNNKSPTNSNQNSPRQDQLLKLNRKLYLNYKPSTLMKQNSNSGSSFITRRTDLSNNSLDSFPDKKTNSIKRSISTRSMTPNFLQKHFRTLKSFDHDSSISNRPESCSLAVMSQSSTPIFPRKLVPLQCNRLSTNNSFNSLTQIDSLPTKNNFRPMNIFNFNNNNNNKGSSPSQKMKRSTLFSLPLKTKILR